jgi:general secretion pathway protein A
MYETFYGLREPPFSLTPDPKFLFMTPDQREALAYLKYGVHGRKGILVLSGEVGVGKTMIVRTLLSQLDESVSSALVMNAMLTFSQLVRMALLDFGVVFDGRGKVDLLIALQEYLLETHHRGRNALIVVDEAQNLSPSSLEEFRLLSNLETSTQKLLQIVLVGQPELKQTLNSYELRQLRQRIPGICELRPLAPEGVGEYIEHRLRVASGRAVGQLFEREAIAAIAAQTRGVPRLINALCDRALLIAYVNDQRRVQIAQVREAIAEIEGGFRPGGERGAPTLTGSER